MTAVIGMLNKQGVAIAADSAVTRTRGYQSKVTKNGNKMIRVSNVVPISVMITGNAGFLNNPWDIIIRKYRQEQGDIDFPTVEAAVENMLGYVAQNEALWNPVSQNRWIEWNIECFMDKLFLNLGWEATVSDKNGNLLRPRRYVKEITKALRAAQKYYFCDNQGCKDYSFEKFETLIRPCLEDYLNTKHEMGINQRNKMCLKNMLNEVGEELFKGIYAYLTCTRREGSSTLIFTGYGKDEIYPSLIAIDLNGGLDHHINWSLKRYVKIDDETSAAICPFAQTDVINALLSGAAEPWLNTMDENIKLLLDPQIFVGTEMETENPDGLQELKDIPTSNLYERHHKGLKKIIRENWLGWIKDLERYDVKAMAQLASTLIELTGLQRILTFQQEGVGGDVDLAVITKTDGFTWLNRKSWYHHKDIGGHYGAMGI